MFRHSEIQALLREKRKASESTTKKAASQSKTCPEKEDLEYGRLSPVNFSASGSPSSMADSPDIGSGPDQSNGRKKQKVQKGHFKRNIKPDLRKRTWDKVDQGLGSLDYEDEVQPQPSSQQAGRQRRKVSYDDI
jgi:hypothetical protein